MSDRVSGYGNPTKENDPVPTCPYCGRQKMKLVAATHNDGWWRFECEWCGASAPKGLTPEEAYGFATIIDTPAAPHEMSAREYFKQVRRLQNWAEQLQLQYHKANETLYKVSDGDIDSSIEEVEKWAWEHPEVSE